MESKGRVYILLLIAVIVIAIIFLTGKGVKQENSINQAPQQQGTTAQDANKPENVATQENTNKVDGGAKNITVQQTGTSSGSEFTQSVGNGVSLNTSNQLKNKKTYEGLEFSDIQLSKKNTSSELLATVKNTTTKEIPFQLLKFKFVDKDKKEIITISCGVKKLAPGETTEVSASASTDFVNAYDFEITK